jgi:4-alpha-glucanotransferase
MGRRESAAAIKKILSQYEPPAGDPVRVVWENRRVPEGEIELEEGGSWSRRHPLPFGYHTLNGETLLIHAPRKAYAPPEKTWGLFLPLYAVPPNGGDLGDLEAYMDWVRSMGGSVVATLPLLAAFDDEPSPYSPVSRLFWNERYLDVEALPEYRGDRDLKACSERFVPDAAFEKFAEHARDYARFRGDERYHLYVQYRMAQQMDRLSRRGLYLDFPLGVNGGGYDVQKYAHVFAKGASVGAPPDSFFTKGQNWGFPPFHPEALRTDHYRYFRAAIAYHARHASILRLDHVMGLHRLYWIPDGMDPKDGVYVRYHDEELYAIVVLESVRNRCVIVGEDLGTVPKYVPLAMERHGLRRMYVVQYEAKPEPLPDPPAASVASVNTHDMPTFAAFWSGKDIDDRVEQDLLDEDGARKEGETREKIREQIGGDKSVCSTGRSSSVQSGAVPSGCGADKSVCSTGRGSSVQSRAVTSGCGADTPVCSDHALEQILKFLASSAAEVVLVNPEDLWGELEPQNVPGIPEKSWKQLFRLSLEDARQNERVMSILRAVAEARALLSSDGGQ